MNNKKIAVMAGTPVDTNFGIDLLKNITTNIISLPVSSTPEEQTIFQTSNYSKRFTHIVSMIEKENIDILFVYCNSLSASINFNEISKICNIKVITPLNFYEHISTNYSSIALLTANAQGASGIEKTIINKNNNIQLYSVSSLEWVKAIENSISPNEIFNKLGLKELLLFFEKIKVECILFGCTHFPYFLEILQKETNIPCICPNNYMISSLKKFIAENK